MSLWAVLLTSLLTCGQVDRQSLPQVQRLKTRAQFQAVLAGRTVARTTHFALHCSPLDVSGPMPSKPLPIGAKSNPLFAVSDVWMGAMVPKKWAKRAVTRNAVKRQIYTVSALLAQSLSPVAHVVRLRAAWDRKVFASATSEDLKAAVCVELNLLFAQAIALRDAPA